MLILFSLYHKEYLSPSILVLFLENKFDYRENIQKITPFTDLILILNFTKSKKSKMEFTYPIPTPDHNYLQQLAQVCLEGQFKYEFLWNNVTKHIIIHDIRASTEEIPVYYCQDNYETTIEESIYDLVGCEDDDCWTARNITVIDSEGNLVPTNSNNFQNAKWSDLIEQDLVTQFDITVFGPPPGWVHRDDYCEDVGIDDIFNDICGNPEPVMIIINDN